MGALDSLRQSLKATNAQAFHGLSFDHERLEQEVQKLKGWLGSSAMTKPPSNLILEALSRFYKAVKTENLRDTRLICYGCVDPVNGDPFGENSYRLIEDPLRFPKLLDCVDEYRTKPRPFRRCYKGLLNGYFAYDPDLQRGNEEGRQNWEKLRGYLHEGISSLQGEGTLPDWVQALAEHRNLATEHACDRYGLSLLEDETNEFSEAQRKLEISEASWVTRRLILAQIDAGTKQNDWQFKGYITRLLNLLESHKVVLNIGLASILTRYQRNTNPGLHPELRDFAVSHWGNPWLVSNSARWSLVRDETRAMIADWLKLEIIYQFFNLLAEDGSGDTRRLKFWQRYHKHIDHMYFALGRRAIRNRSRDFEELRKKMEGRLLGLYSAGPPENNAFIMCIGEYVVVEFGRKGNACFIFRRNALPFALTGKVAGDSTELKHEVHVERLLHFDRIRHKWEGNFESVLYRLLHVRPASLSELPPGVSASAGGDSTPIAAPPVQGVTAAKPNVAYAPKLDPYYTRREFERFCAVRRFDVRDMTGVGGNLWVVIDDSDEWVSRQLRAWGFTYKENKGWWRKRG